MDAYLSFESFYEGAKTAAHRAMDDHGRGEYDEFALHAGVAIERLAKAVLVSKNPIYIAEMRGSAEMLFHLGGNRTASKVRTIGAAEAISRLRTLQILPPDGQLDLLIDLRNGVAHSAGTEQGKSLLAALAKVVHALHDGLGKPVMPFWDRWNGAVQIAVDHQRDQTERDVQVRIRQARHRFEDRFKGLPDDVLEGVQSPLRKRRSEWFPGGIHKETGRPGPPMGWFPCPACTNKALIVLATPNGDDPNDNELFGCFLCGLRLVGSDEFKAAKLVLPEAPVF
ncbi:hypothetical protein ACFV2X_14925 [Streptomyces sp. NPDC059679]|uniref:hypothetical protein n=1 Tax=Streptomyces sp. NPDC059679 TaxID=3346903 RepID=UPI0036C2B965